ncbi:hypothetical protein [Bifidobacterium cuniculi]|uniref:hypothetical protein n=1 Tax=Bifidobacterium cuniculi TaxID=1688 RepID=UPI000529F869|nr:hypothetical protein [Bifidobacterium cuniculi]
MEARNLIVNPQPYSVADWNTAGRDSDIELRTTSSGDCIYTRNLTGASDLYVRTIVRDLLADDYIYAAYIATAQVPPAKTLRVIQGSPLLEIASCAFRDGMNLVRFTLETTNSVELRMNISPTKGAALNFQHIGLYTEESFTVMRRQEDPVRWFSGDVIERGGVPS